MTRMVAPSAGPRRSARTPLPASLATTGTLTVCAPDRMTSWVGAASWQARNSAPSISGRGATRARARRWRSSATRHGAGDLAVGVALALRIALVVLLLSLAER